MGNKKVKSSSGGAVYGLGMIGAWVYYIGNAEGFVASLIGFFKGIVWPGFLVHGLMEFLKLK